MKDPQGQSLPFPPALLTAQGAPHSLNDIPGCTKMLALGNTLIYLSHGCFTATLVLGTHFWDTFINMHKKVDSIVQKAVCTYKRKFLGSFNDPPAVPKENV